MNRLMVATLVLALTGCASFTSPARKHAIEDQSYWMDYTASRRGAVVLQQNKEDERWFVCSEPAPDVALESLNTLEGDIEGSDVEIANAKADISTEAIKLAKRTQMVSYLRESLYRLCELSISNDFSDKQATNMYMAVVNAAEKIAQAEVEQAIAAQDEAKTEKTKAEAEKITAINTFLEGGGDTKELKTLQEKLDSLEVE